MARFFVEPCATLRTQTWKMWRWDPVIDSKLMGSVPFEHIEPWVLARKIWFRFQHIKLFQLIDFRPSCEMSEANNQQWHAPLGVRVHIASHDHPNTMCQFFGMLVQAWKLLLPSQNWSENRTREAHMFLFCTYALKREKYCPHSLEQQRVIYTHYYYFCNFAWLRVSTFPKSPGARPKLPEAKISEQATSWTYSWTDTVAMGSEIATAGNTTD